MTGGLDVLVSNMTTAAACVGAAAGMHGDVPLALWSVSVDGLRVILLQQLTLQLILIVGEVIQDWSSGITSSLAV